MQHSGAMGKQPADFQGKMVVGQTEIYQNPNVSLHTGLIPVSNPIFTEYHSYGVSSCLSLFINNLESSQSPFIHLL